MMYDMIEARLIRAWISTKALKASIEENEGRERETI